MGSKNTYKIPLLLITLTTIFTIYILLLPNNGRYYETIQHKILNVFPLQLQQQLKQAVSSTASTTKRTTTKKKKNNTDDNATKKKKKVPKKEKQKERVELGNAQIKLLKLQLEYDENRNDDMFFSSTSDNKIKFMIHHNGNVNSCGNSSDSSSSSMSFFDAIQKSVGYIEKNPTRFTKYEVDSILTSAFAYDVLSNVNTCGEEEAYDGDERYGSNLLDYCDMGEDKTPILPDHNKHIRVVRRDEDDGGSSKKLTLPCHFHTREGMRIGSFTELTDYVKHLTAQGIDSEDKTSNKCINNNDDGDDENTCSSNMNTITELHLYAVPAGRVFMFAPSYIGETFHLPHVTSTNELSNKQISLEVLSIKPRIFDIKNFFNADEAQEIITLMLEETSETHRMKRSSTGSTGYTVSSRRTSENGFDTSSATAMKLKKRCFSTLGMDEYDESFADGLQILRYKVSTAYIAHQDFVDDPSGRDEHNYDSSLVGTNRFATVLLYMSDLPDDVDGNDIDADSGGHVVFPRSHLPDGQGLSKDEALEKIHSSKKLSNLFKRNSWEEKLLVECHSKNKLSIKPYKARAILFYSQYPNGEEDINAYHGACPVIHGIKWAANLWVWNGPRNGYPTAPVNHAAVALNSKDKKPKKPQSSNQPKQLHAGFTNTNTNPKYKNAKLYFEDTFWANLGFGDEGSGVNTFKGHRWNIRVDDEVILKWVIDDRDVQTYEI